MPRYHESGLIRFAVAVPATVFAFAFPSLVIASVSERMYYLSEGTLYAIAFLLTVNGAYSLYLLYNKKQTVRIVQVVQRLAIGLLLSVFIGGWALPQLNAYTGYGTLCDKAMELSHEQGITDLRTWHIPHPRNIDVYLRHPVKVISNEELPISDASRPFLLLTRKRELKHFPGKEVQVVGPYAIVVCR